MESSKPASPASFPMDPNGEPFRPGLRVDHVHASDSRDPERFGMRVHQTQALRDRSGRFRLPKERPRSEGDGSSRRGVDRAIRASSSASSPLSWLSGHHCEHGVSHRLPRELTAKRGAGIESSPSRIGRLAQQPGISRFLLRACKSLSRARTGPRLGQPGVLGARQLCSAFEMLPQLARITPRRRTGATPHLQSTRHSRAWHGRCRSRRSVQPGGSF